MHSTNSGMGKLCDVTFVDSLDQYFGSFDTAV